MAGIKYTPFKRGDTPVFTFVFTAPYTGFNCSTILADGVLTSVTNPSDNSGAAVIRLNQTLSVNGTTNAATFTMQPTVAESKALVPGTTYNVEVQLKDNAGTNVATAVSGTVVVNQDFII